MFIYLDVLFDEHATQCLSRMTQGQKIGHSRYFKVTFSFPIIRFDQKIV